MQKTERYLARVTVSSDVFELILALQYLGIINLTLLFYITM
jgi:hypothetical protein